MRFWAHDFRILQVGLIYAKNILYIYIYICHKLVSVTPNRGFLELLPQDLQASSLSEFRVILVCPEIWKDYLFWSGTWPGSQLNTWGIKNEMVDFGAPIYFVTSLMRAVLARWMVWWVSKLINSLPDPKMLYYFPWDRRSVKKGLNMSQHVSTYTKSSYKCSWKVVPSVSPFVRFFRTSKVRSSWIKEQVPKQV